MTKIVLESHERNMKSPALSFLSSIHNSLVPSVPLFSLSDAPNYSSPLISLYSIPSSNWAKSTGAKRERVALFPWIEIFLIRGQYQRQWNESNMKKEGWKGFLLWKSVIGSSINVSPPRSISISKEQVETKNYLNDEWYTIGWRIILPEEWRDRSRQRTQWTVKYSWTLHRESSCSVDRRSRLRMESANGTQEGNVMMLLYLHHCIHWQTTSNLSVGSCPNESCD